jgi:hypothetical protein
MNTQASIYNTLKSRIAVGAMTCTIGVAAFGGTAGAATVSNNPVSRLLAAVAGTKATVTTTYNPVQLPIMPPAQDLCLGGSGVTFDATGGLTATLGAGC